MLNERQTVGVEAQQVPSLCWTTIRMRETARRYVRTVKRLICTMH